MGVRKRPLTINTEREMGPRGGVDGDITEEEGQPLSPAGRLFHQPHFNCHIISIMGSGKTIDVDAVKAGLERTMIRHPRFSSILVLDKHRSKKSRWIRTKVVVDDHIVIPSLNISSERTPDQIVEDYISSLSTSSLPLTRPLWDLHIINIPTSKSEAVSILRMHHSLGDGISLMSLLLAGTRKISDPDSAPSLPLSRSRKAKSFDRGGMLWRLMVWIWLVLAHFWNTVIDAVMLGASCVFLRDTETPIKGVEGFEFRRKRFVSTTLSLEDAEVVKNAFGCTINDVMLGITSAGLSRYLSTRYNDTSNEKKNAGSLPANIRLRTTLMVNIRAPAGIDEMTKMIEGDNSCTTWGNWLGYMIVPIPIMICKDPLDYIRKGIEIAQRKRTSLEAIFTYITGCLIIKILGIKAAAALCYRVFRHTTVLLSNIAGPVDEIGFCGHPLVYLAASVYGHPQAITLHFQSYMNKMEMVLAVDELTVPDPHQLLQDLAESLKLIKDAVVERSS
ncbi:O-acyltransferase WSD1-like [Asparagus officinalis]|uniref:O-acyltransferase WSD1-like n=1 Tax=Asparagus officinalis TaxID=4686 RepID=UPI00098E4097|nr:O-acyltransferase WSD1-like [Asparagus officinalis]